jgi:RNA polymerase sigma-70 factor (ECF subfamily)
VVGRGGIWNNKNPSSHFSPQENEPDKLLMVMQLEGAIQREIAALEDDQRILIILRDVQGMSYQDIASITQLPEGTIKSRLHRARMTLKDRLQSFM